MTNPVFVVPSVGKSPDGSRNRPINISHCICLTKDYHFSGGLSAGRVIYMILFEGCIDDQGKLLSWGYPTQQEQDADYDRILKAFAGSSPAEPEPKPEPVSDAMVLEDVINWLKVNAMEIAYFRTKSNGADFYEFMEIVDHILAELRKAMLAERGEK